ncbi:MAG: hypothetical protein SNJ69_15775 [Chloroflexaceae bacterium]
MKASYPVAVVMGLMIGLLAILLDMWVSQATWGVRLVALVLVGSALCLVQFGLTRRRL